MLSLNDRAHRSLVICTFQYPRDVRCKAAISKHSSLGDPVEALKAMTAPYFNREGPLKRYFAKRSAETQMRQESSGLLMHAKRQNPEGFFLSEVVTVILLPRHNCTLEFQPQTRVPIHVAFSFRTFGSWLSANSYRLSITFESSCDAEGDRRAALMEQRNDGLRLYSFCSRYAVLQPIARLLRVIELYSITHDRSAKLIKKCCQDPGLPCNNPTISFWQNTPHPLLSDIQSTTLTSETDVLIVGSGITAASVAYHLLSRDESIKVTIAEARTITSGATGRNGGHILELPYEDYGLLAAMLGERAAKDLIRFRLDHLEEMLGFAKSQMNEKAVKECEIRKNEVADASFDEQQWLDTKANFQLFLKAFPEQQGKWRTWEGEEARKNFGMPHVFGVITGPAGALWPYKFITSIYEDLLEAYGARFRIETHTPVLGIESAKLDCPFAFVSRTHRGSIMSKHVIHATNGHAGHLLPRMRGKIFPLRGQMTVQSLPGAECATAGVDVGSRSWIFRHGRGFDYMTQNPSSGHFFLGGGTLQGGNGGLDDISNNADDEENVLALSHLTGILKQAFCHSSSDAQNPSLVSSWTGIMGFSCDGRPWVGRLPNTITDRFCGVRGGVFCSEWIAAGFCGSGMVYCWRSGQALAAMILGENSDFLPACLAPTKERFRQSTIDEAALQWIAMSI